VCSAPESFELVKKAGTSAPGAPQAVEGITPNIRLTFNNPITQTVNTSSMTAWLVAGAGATGYIAGANIYCGTPLKNLY
jgi:hypothetical protein